MPNTFSVQFNTALLQPAFMESGAQTLAVRLAANLTLAKGTILGEVTATPGLYKAYASGNSDGSQVAKLILGVDVVTDASGNVQFSDQAGSEWGETHLTAPAWCSGTFRTEDLTGLDATAVGNLGRLIQGSTSTGLLRLI